MTESAGLTLIETQVKAVTGFNGTPTNVSISKWGILNSGISDHYAVIRPGPAERPRLTMRIRDQQYRTVIEVWQRYKDDGTTLTSLLTHVNNITARLDKYRKLADTTGTIRNADASSLGDVTEQWRDNADGPSWLKREINVDWTEETNVTYAE